MHNQSFVFAQLASHLNRSKFNRIVAKYQGDSYIKVFSCWNQLKVLMFGQLSRRESLRDLMVAVKAHSGKAKFLGFGDSVTLSNLAKANQTRDYHIFEEYAYYMVELARNLKDTTIFNLGGTVYAFDSTTIGWNNRATVFMHLWGGVMFFSNQFWKLEINPYICSGDCAPNGGNLNRHLALNGCLYFFPRILNRGAVLDTGADSSLNLH